MVNYPNSLDDDGTIPPVYDNLSEIGETTINALRDAVFSLEGTLGINPQGSALSVASRLAVSLNDDGTIRPASLIGIGLVSLPITNSQISSTANIQESKLSLTYSTQFLHDLFANLDTAVENLNDFVSIYGIKIEPHVEGTAYRHKLSHIDVDSGSLSKVNITSGLATTRNLTNAYTFTSELSNDLLLHTKADGINDDTVPPAKMAHNATGIHIDPQYFISVPGTVDDLQSFAEYVDSSSLALLGSRTQNLYENGIPKAARCTSLTNDKAAEAIVPPTPAITYLLYGAATSPVNDIDHGDNIIYLQPTTDVLANNTFDAQFSQVKPGDYITVSFDGYTTTVTYTIDSVKKFQNGSTRVYTVRINGKNLMNSSEAVVRIDRPFYHDQKFNSLAVSPANNSFNGSPSLIINSARGASALGVGFYPDQIDNSHYNLYLALYPTGNPLQKTIFLPAIDVSGNQGATPGLYTLESIVYNINQAVRKPGFNYRFNAFVYQGQLGISLADHYNDASFSIISGTVDTNGNYTSTSLDGYLNNVVDNYGGFDAFGMGVTGANLATPPFSTSYSTALASLNAPTLIFSPLRRAFFYVDGVEKDNFALEPLITRDGYGDGYWLGTLTTRTQLSGRVECTYEILLDLSTSGLEIGKTVIIEPAVSVTSGSYNSVDYGRFTINNVVFNNCPGPDPITLITVYDGIHGVGYSPTSSSVNIPVKVYFDSDTVSFDTEQVSDSNINHTFRRFFEVYLSTTGNSYTHERARINISGTSAVVDTANGFTLYSDTALATLKIVDVSPKLAGYSFGEYKKINLFITSFDQTTGIFTGNLGKYVYPSTYSQPGPTFTGKKGEVVRAYDITEVDYIDFKFDANESMSSFTSKCIDIQLYPSLELNQEKLLIGKCSVNDTNSTVEAVYDVRPFGNVSEQQLSTSALNYISAPERLMLENGIIRGFDLIQATGAKINISGGVALINGKLVEFNDKSLYVPVVQEALYPSFSTTINNLKWYLCANSDGDLELIASTDYDLTQTSTYGSLDHDRIFYAQNPNSLSTPPYAIRSGYLQKIVKEYKDVIPLFIINSTTTSDIIYTTSISNTADIRRFVSQGYGGMQNVKILANTGSYRTFSSLLNTLNDLLNNISYSKTAVNSLSQEVYVRDNFDISGYSLGFTTKVKFIGDGGKLTTSTSPCTLFGNVEFFNMGFDIKTATGLQVRGSDIKIDSCIFNYTFDASTDGQFVSSRTSNFTQACIFDGYINPGGSNPDTGAHSNFTVKNCKFTTNQSSHFPFICLSLYTPSPTFFHQNVNIIDNYMESTASGDDKRSVITVVGLAYSSVPTTKTLARIVNCNISRNVCNKNQLIVFSGEPNGSGTLVNLPIPVNCQISDNVCGAICFLTGADIALNIANSTLVADKQALLKISGNVCRYIYNGTAYGYVNVVGHTQKALFDIVSGINLYTSSTILEKNTCSWMHVGVRNPLSWSIFNPSVADIPQIVITNNKINAYDSAFLTSYWSVITPINIGLIVDNTQGT